MIGGYFNEHLFCPISVRRNDPTSPIPAPFEGRGVEVTDEIYPVKNTYSREKLRVLFSIEGENSVDLEGADRTDNDDALIWIREYGGASTAPLVVRWPSGGIRRSWHLRWPGSGMLLGT